MADDVIATLRVVWGTRYSGGYYPVPTTLPLVLAGANSPRTTPKKHKTGSKPKSIWNRNRKWNFFVICLLLFSRKTPLLLLSATVVSHCLLFQDVGRLTKTGGRCALPRFRFLFLRLILLVFAKFEHRSKSKIDFQLRSIRPVEPIV